MFGMGFPGMGFGGFGGLGGFGYPGFGWGPMSYAYYRRWGCGRFWW